MTTTSDGGSRRVCALAIHQFHSDSRSAAEWAVAKSLTRSSTSMTLKPIPVIDWPGAERDATPPPSVVCQSETDPASWAIFRPNSSPCSSTMRRTCRPHDTASVGECDTRPIFQSGCWRSNQIGRLTDVSADLPMRGGIETVMNRLSPFSTSCMAFASRWARYSRWGRLRYPSSVCMAASSGSAAFG